MWKYINPNPCGKSTGDCTVRALSKVLNVSWKTAYRMICDKGEDMCLMPPNNAIFNAVLSDHGFISSVINDSTVKEFCRGHPKGVYVVGTGTHVVAIINGDYYDSWDSGNEDIIYYWKERDNVQLSKSHDMGSRRRSGKSLLTSTEYDSSLMGRGEDRNLFKIDRYVRQAFYEDS